MAVNAKEGRFLFILATIRVIHLAFTVAKRVLECPAISVPVQPNRAVIDINATSGDMLFEPVVVVAAYGMPHAIGRNAECGKRSMSQQTPELRQRPSKDQKMLGNKRVRCSLCGWEGKRKNLPSHTCVPLPKKAS